ncbi:uncharacterized protein [Chironomus tepperi]|uniref:uncharacterized protein n=1 Tax=Chironomus tepperi TaxID=113505 RepID=UPI00391F6ED1
MDTNMMEIINRDSRTAVSLLKIKTKSSNLEFNEIEEICDKNQIKFTKRSTLRSVQIHRNCSKRLLNYLTVVLSIYFILSINQSEANPIISRKRFENGKIFNHKCGSDLGDRITKMNDRNLKERLKSILLSCEDTLVQTKALSEEYIKVMWNTTVQEHHESWKHHKVPEWIHPEGVPLKKQYSEKIPVEHRIELEAVHWKDHKKVFEYLGKIYQRLERIYVGVEIVNKWIEMARTKDGMLKEQELQNSEILFKNVTEGIKTVLCNIQELFLDVDINPTTDLDITPFKMDDLIKINHWLIYREYENLMEYSNELLSLIVARYSNVN